MSNSSLTKRLSVVIVSDYEDKPQKSWETEKLILAAIANQDVNEQFDVLLIENDKERDRIPEFLYRILPDLRMVFCPYSESAKLKDHGCKEVGTEFVAVLEADCIPCEGWVRILLDVFSEQPDVSVVSGRTYYGEETAYRRCMNLLGRSFDDLGEAGSTTYISNNGAIYRRAVLERFPYPEAATPFLSSRMRNQSIRENGHILYFNSKATMRHAIGGLDFFRDVCRNTGYSDMMYHGEVGYWLIPILLCRRTFRDLYNFWRVGSKYLRWFDWPIVFSLMFFSRSFEIPGMIDAVKSRAAIPNSAYR